MAERVAPRESNLLPLIDMATPSHFSRYPVHGSRRLWSEGIAKRRTMQISVSSECKEPTQDRWSRRPICTN